MGVNSSNDQAWAPQCRIWKMLDEASTVTVLRGLRELSSQETPIKGEGLRSPSLENIFRTAWDLSSLSYSYGTLCVVRKEEIERKVRYVEKETSFIVSKFQVFKFGLGQE